MSCKFLWKRMKKKKKTLRKNIPCDSCSICVIMCHVRRRRWLCSELHRQDVLSALNVPTNWCSTLFWLFLLPLPKFYLVIFMYAPKRTVIVLGLRAFEDFFLLFWGLKQHANKTYIMRIETFEFNLLFL